MLLSNNEPLQERLSTKKVLKKHYMDVPIGNYSAKVKLLLPPSFNWGSDTKYPIVVEA